jgi:hypothetical protein
MSRSSNRYVSDQGPIFDKAFEAGAINSRTFTLCLGIDGGYFQLGGFTTEYFLTE